MRVRGLKLSKVGEMACAKVAPHAGAWIETNKKTPIDLEELSRTPCGCVD